MTGAPAGFSLVELLVAVAALAVLAGLAGLSVQFRPGAAPRDADRFLAAARLQLEEAVHRGAPRALRITATGFVAETRAEGGWQAAGEAVDWRGTAAWQGRAPALRILFWPAGQVSDFALDLDQDGQVWRCAPVAGQLPACAARP